MAYDLHLADRIREILKVHGNRVSERNMFGGVAFMLNGHMCCGVAKTDLMLRLAPEAVEAALGRPHTRPMDFTGRPMKSMLFVDPAGMDSDQSLREWVESACAFVRTLPAKEPAARSRPQRSRGRSR
jgi:TfoX/Sxy family transcriptional regulator of competence genes